MFSWLRFWSLVVMVAWLCLVWIWRVASFSFHLCYKCLHFARIDFLFLFDWMLVLQLKRAVSPEHESESSDFGSACYVFFQIEFKTVVVPPQLKKQAAEWKEGNCNNKIFMQRLKRAGTWFGPITGRRSRTSKKILDIFRNVFNYIPLVMQPMYLCFTQLHFQCTEIVFK